LADRVMDVSAPQSKQLSIRSLQQALLLAIGAVVPFVASIQHGKPLLHWSAALRQLLGVPAGRRGWRGGPLFNSRIAADDADKLRDAITRLIEHGEPLDLRYSVDTGAASRCLQICARLQSAGAVGKSRMIGVFKDCSMQASEETQLQTSQQRLHSIGRLALLGEVAASLAHELNQPLTALVTFAQAGERLLNLPLPRLEKAQQVFREVSQQALRAGEIIRHMRSLINRRPTQLESLHGASLLEDFLVLAEPMARAVQIQLRLHSDVTDQMIMADLTQIHQALMILLQNALEATAEQCPANPQVCMKLCAQPDGLEFAIEDQGPGINKAVALQLFQPFFTTKENGTGLGLIICRNILEAHGARLTYQNLHPTGCRFWFVLPYLTT
jgi:two-component system, LuxR family, sensor kinase FixL